MVARPLGKSIYGYHIQEIAEVNIEPFDLVRSRLAWVSYRKAVRKELWERRIGPALLSTHILHPYPHIPTHSRAHAMHTSTHLDICVACL